MQRLNPEYCHCKIRVPSHPAKQGHKSATLTPSVLGLRYKVNAISILRTFQICTSPIATSFLSHAIDAPTELANPVPSGPQVFFRHSSFFTRPGSPFALPSPASSYPPWKLESPPHSSFRLSISYVKFGS